MSEHEGKLLERHRELKRQFALLQRFSAAKQRLDESNLSNSGLKLVLPRVLKTRKNSDAEESLASRRRPPKSNEEKNGSSVFRRALLRKDSAPTKGSSSSAENSNLESGSAGADIKGKRRDDDDEALKLKSINDAFKKYGTPKVARKQLKQAILEFYRGLLMLENYRVN